MGFYNVVIAYVALTFLGVTTFAVVTFFQHFRGPHSTHGLPWYSKALFYYGGVWCLLSVGAGILWGLYQIGELIKVITV